MAVTHDTENFHVPKGAKKLEGIKLNRPERD